MPQRKNEVATTGIWPALRGSLLPLVGKFRSEVDELLKAFGPMERVGHSGKHPIKRSCTREEILDGRLSLLAQIAVMPELIPTNREFHAHFLYTFYSIAPSFTLAFMTKARKVWFKTTRRAKLESFMAFGTVKPLAHQKTCSIYKCVDGEVATGFEAATGIRATIGDVEQARRSLNKRLKRGVHFPLKV